MIIQNVEIEQYVSSRAKTIEEYFQMVPGRITQCYSGAAKALETIASDLEAKHPNIEIHTVCMFDSVIFFDISKAQELLEDAQAEWIDMMDYIDEQDLVGMIGY